MTSPIALTPAREDDPAFLEQHPEVLATARKDDVAEVRRNVCSVIGKGPLVIEPGKLEELATEDPDEFVRERAAWAVQQLEH